MIKPCRVYQNDVIKIFAVLISAVVHSTENFTQLVLSRRFFWLLMDNDIWRVKCIIRTNSTMYLQVLLWIMYVLLSVARDFEVGFQI